MMRLSAGNQEKARSEMSALSSMEEETQFACAYSYRLANHFRRR